MCILNNVIVPEMRYAGTVWGGNANSAKQLDRVQMTVANKVLECSKTTSHGNLRVELGMFPLETNKREEMKITLKHKEHTNKEIARISAIVHRAVWKKVTEVQAGIR